MTYMTGWWPTDHSQRPRLPTIVIDPSQVIQLRHALDLEKNASRAFGVSVHGIENPEYDGNKIPFRYMYHQYSLIQHE